MKKLSGIYNDLSNDDYHGERTHLSSSNLKTLLKDVELFHEEKILGKKKESKEVPAFSEGNYAHSLILEPHTIDDAYAFFPGFRKSGQDWESFKEENSGKIILSKPQKARVEKWVEAYKKRIPAVELIKGSKPEVSLFSELCGVPVKVRADAINVEQGYIADVKTTSYDSDRDTFKYVIDSLKYDLSAALYCEVFSEYYKKNFDFYFIVLGKKDNLCHVYKASEKTIASGKVAVTNALNIYKKCLETGDWTNAKKIASIEIDDDYEILEV